MEFLAEVLEKSRSVTFLKLHSYGCSDSEWQRVTFAKRGSWVTWEHNWLRIICDEVECFFRSSRRFRPILEIKKQKLKARSIAWQLS